jgi:hypothetical protein
MPFVTFTVRRGQGRPNVAGDRIVFRDNAATGASAAGTGHDRSVGAESKASVLFVLP